MTVNQKHGELEANVSEFLGHSHSPLCSCNALMAKMGNNVLQVRCGNESCGFIIPNAPITIPLEYRHLTRYFQFNFNGPITINHNYYSVTTTEGISPMPVTLLMNNS